MKTLIKGPTYVEPPPPAPYYLCKGCTHYSCRKIRMSPDPANPGRLARYDKRCKHPDVGSTVYLSAYVGDTHRASPKTPKWCPFLQEE